MASVVVSGGFEKGSIMIGQSVCACVRESERAKR